MTINANLIAQVQAQIDAAGSGNTLEELWNLKLIARGLGCDESNVDTLMDLLIDEMDGDTELKSLLQAAIATRPYARNIVRKSVEILTSQNWTAPANLAGNTVWLTGCAGAGSGVALAAASSANAYGGFGGCFVVRRPVVVAPESVHAVVIGAGGTGVTSSAEGQFGGDTSFGALLTIKGGSPGRQIDSSTSKLRDALSTRGIRPAIIDFASTPEMVICAAESVNGNSCGNPSGGSGTGEVTGGGAGYFGNGANSSSSAGAITGANAPANSGAGSGCVFGAAGSASGNAGSGRLIIEWDEYQ